MTASDAIKKGREAFARRAWSQAHRHLSAADDEARLDADDLERLASAAYLSGKEAVAIALWKRLYKQLCVRGEPNRAARCAFWISLNLMFGGERSQSAGWQSRAQRLLGQDAGCAEDGLLSILAGLFAMGKGEAVDALECFDRAHAIAERFPDDDLMAFCLLSRGQALIQSQRTSEGTSSLDEAMVTVASGEVSPMAAGIVYCAAILTSQRIFDLGRAREWTAALNGWCAAQPEMIPFRGQCLVHRSEILTFCGEWTSALEEAERSCEWFRERTERASGRALYQLGEIHRLRGELDRADDLYREAGNNGLEPQPGLSLLRLAQGDVGTATAAIRRVVDEASDRQGPRAGTPRATVLGPYVEIMVAAGELESARAGAEELLRVAGDVDAPLLLAQAAQAAGTVALADGQPGEALKQLRVAWRIWQQLEAPYEAARARALIGRACEHLGDTDTATSHLDAARAVLNLLGARPALAALDREERRRDSTVPGGLTPREREVVALVSAGKTNRQIGDALSISEHTVARHVANIFNKLGVSSRTAAAAFAIEHGLV